MYIGSLKKKLFLNAVFTPLIVSVFFALSLVDAGNVSYKSVYTTGSNTCSLSTGTATLSASQESDFNIGNGIAQGGKVIYKSNKLYDCCVDQMAGKDSVNGCMSLPPITANPGSEPPWLSTSNGNLHIKYGSLLSSTPTTGYFKSNPQYSKKSEFTYSSPNSSSLAGTDLSYNDYLLFNYDSGALKPPALTGFDSWYAYLKKLVLINTKPQDKGAVGTLSGNLSGKFGATGGTFYTTGNVTINAKSNCDTRALIFVEGDLTINPSFKIPAQSPDVKLPYACLFIVKGKVTVKGGDPAAQGVKLGAKDYDLLQMGVISESDVVVEYDDVEPIKIEGFITGRKTNLQRDTESVDYPSVWVEYDPRYIESFVEELKLLRFSTKERGYVDPI